jgi:ATP synthase proteolipid subunit
VTENFELLPRQWRRVTLQPSQQDQIAVLYGRLSCTCVDGTICCVAFELLYWSRNLETEAARQISEVYDVTKRRSMAFFMHLWTSPSVLVVASAVCTHVLEYSEYYFSSPRTCMSYAKCEVKFCLPQIGGNVNSTRSQHNPCPLNSFSGYAGAASCLILANFGSAWGTWRAGVGVCSMGVDYSKGVIKNIVPIVMAGVLGIYGLIVAVIIAQAITPPSATKNTMYSAYNGYAHVSRCSFLIKQNVSCNRALKYSTEMYNSSLPACAAVYHVLLLVVPLE